MINCCGSPESEGKEIIPLGDHINVNGQPFRIIGMFKHYESEQDRKLREIEKNQPKPEQTGPQRRRGWGSRRGGMNSWVFNMKNSTIYIPLNTMWIKFRSGGIGTNNLPDPHLNNLFVKIADIKSLEPALQQARNVLMHTHKGIKAHLSNPGELVRKHHHRHPKSTHERGFYFFDRFAGWWHWNYEHHDQQHYRTDSRDWNS